MSEMKSVMKSPYDLIIDTMIEKLSQHSEFGPADLARIREMSINGDLKRTENILALIQSHEERFHETA